MKTKKALAVFLSVFLFTANLFSESTNDFSVSLSPYFFLRNGSINEYVFNSACLNTGNKESQLDWDVENIPFLGFQSEIKFYRNFYFGLNAFTSIAEKRSGYMQDYDWLNSLGGIYGTHTEWKKQDPTELTNYSIHDNYFKQWYGISFDFGGTFTVFENYTLMPYVSYEYEYFAFEAYDGYCEYKENNRAKDYFSGRVISYFQEYNALFCGLKFKTEFFNRLDLKLDLRLSPWTCFLIARDNHYLGHYAFIDDIKNTFVLEGKCFIGYKISQNHFIKFMAQTQYIPISKGQDYKGTIDSDGNLIDSVVGIRNVNGGTSRFVWDLSICYEFCLPVNLKK